MDRVKDDADLTKLQGTWQQVHYERDGVVQPVDEEQGWSPVTLIAGNRFSVTIADGSVLLEGTFSHLEAQDPKAIDWLDESGPYASDHPILAIYEVTATSFAFCAAYDGAARPSRFATGPGQVLRRMKRI
jgi:uncharacterized protein (TIGR03067 family)